MNQKIKAALFSVLMLFNVTANAQEFNVHNNAEVKAVASKAEITRLAFDSPVLEIHALSEELEYAINGRDIYLRLTAEKPVNFFVKTEDEMTYKIILVASDIPSTQEFIHRFAVIDKSRTEYFNQVSLELKTRIAKIIKVTLNPTKYLGYNIAPKPLNLISPVKSLKMKLVTQVNGNKLVAEKIHLRNSSDKSQKLNLKNFISSEYLAVYLSKTELLPKEECVLIKVLEN
jgi:hypothetical protein